MPTEGSDEIYRKILTLLTVSKRPQENWRDAANFKTKLRQIRNKFITSVDQTNLKTYEVVHAPDINY